MRKYKIIKTGLGVVIILLLCKLSSCTKMKDPVAVIGSVNIKVNTAVAYQNMIGFGGAFAWYANLITQSPKKAQITNLLFSDLGMDIIRFKSWYYPDNYPAVKTTSVMTDDNSKTGYDVNNQLYTIAKAANPNVKTLLSSWGPPAGLKSNSSSRQGTLKKDANGFMYDAFGDYWNDILDNTPFNPDYISIQNEPSYVNSGWTTCEWAPTETSSLPGYDIAFDKVYQKIQGRSNRPAMIGPESANIGNGANGNTFSTFSDQIKSRSYLGAFAYHPYNFSSATVMDQTASLLQMVGTYNTRPNFMTEYSDSYDWFTTAQFIHQTLTQANSSAYMYWKMIWTAPSSGTDAAMISISSNGDFAITPFYYVMKHFAKHIDVGYKRIDVVSDDSQILVSGFLNPVATEVTLVIINKNGYPFNVTLEILNRMIKSLSADQSTSLSFYTPVDGLSVDKSFSAPGSSITTVVVGFN